LLPLNRIGNGLFPTSRLFVALADFLGDRECCPPSFESTPKSFDGKSAAFCIRCKWPMKCQRKFGS